MRMRDHGGMDRNEAGPPAGHRNGNQKICSHLHDSFIIRSC